MPTLSRRALISLSDKTDLEPFARALIQLQFEILSTGGTAKLLREWGLPVTDVSDYTGFPEIMDGRVKTLHPKIHGAILGRIDRADDQAACQQHGIVPFELVVVNLYPFEQTIAAQKASGVDQSSPAAIAAAIEQIDIGGPSMIRSAAKNHAYVAVVTNPSQYARVLDEVRAGRVTAAFRRELAHAAFATTARYDRAIADYFAQMTTPAATATGFSEHLQLNFRRQETLRYGENPHQAAAVYCSEPLDPDSLAAAKKRQGKELSYNNLLDLDAAFNIIRDFSEPAACIIKHNNPCGCAIGASLAQAFERAYNGDPISAFGGIVGFNRPVDLETAEQLCVPQRFVEAIIAPGYTNEAFHLLTTKPKWKSSVRLMELPLAAFSVLKSEPEFRRISGGLLVQDRDALSDSSAAWQIVTTRQPTAAEHRDLAFAWKLVKHVKSNAIVLARDGAACGVGAGQMSRLDSAEIAVRKSGEQARGSVCASDAFFPFRDGIDTIARAGVTAVIQPGGSKGDNDAIAACNEQGLTMIFTGRRHFKH